MENKNKDTIKIINFYKNILKNLYKILFVILIFILPLIILGIFIYNKNQFIDINENFGTKISIKSKSNVILGDLIKYNVLLNNGFTGYIIRGKVGYGDGYLYAYKSMIKKGDIIFPYIFSFYGRFNYTGYKDSIIFYKNYYKIILSDYDKDKTILLSKPKKEVDNIEIKFSINCIKTSSIYISPFCKVNLNYFFENGYKYNIDMASDYEKVIGKLFEIGYKDKVCKLLLNYVYYWNIYDKNIEKYIDNCDKESKIYYKLKRFNQILKSLDNNIFETEYKNEGLSFLIFKLISYQRKIIKDGIQNSIENIRSYFYLVEDLLDKDLKDKVVYNLIYYFNNFILKDYLEKSVVNVNIKQDIQNFRNLIEKYNFQYINSLNGKVSEVLKDYYKKIIEKKQNVINQRLTIQTLGGIFKRFIKFYPSFELVDIQYDDNGKKIIPTLQVSVKDLEGNKKQNLFKFVLKYENDNFYIEDVLEVDNKDIYKYLKQYLFENDEVDFNNFLQWYRFFEVPKGETNFCDILINQIRNNISISNCKIADKGEIVFTIRKNDKDYNGKLIFSKDYKILNLIVNGKQLDSKQLNFSSYIGEKGIISFLKQLSKIDFEKDIYYGKYISNIVYLFKTLLGTDIKVLKNVNKKIYTISFSLNGYNFIGNVLYINPYKVKLFNLYFKINNYQKIKIKRFILTIQETNKLKLNKFKIQTLEFLKQFDPEAVEKYNNLKNNR